MNCLSVSLKSLSVSWINQRHKWCQLHGLVCKHFNVFRGIFLFDVCAHRSISIGQKSVIWWLRTWFRTFCTLSTFCTMYENKTDEPCSHNGTGFYFPLVHCVIKIANVQNNDCELNMATTTITNQFTHVTCMHENKSKCIPAIA